MCNNCNEHKDTTLQDQLTTHDKTLITASLGLLFFLLIWAGVQAFLQLLPQ